jgi:hypothetical protein
VDEGRHVGGGIHCTVKNYFGGGGGVYAKGYMGNMSMLFLQMFMESAWWNLNIKIG